MNNSEIRFNGKLVSYSLKMMWISKLLSNNLITQKEFNKMKDKIMSDYNIVSNFTAK